MAQVDGHVETAVQVLQVEMMEQNLLSDLAGK